MAATLLIVDDEPRIFGALRRALHREPLRLLHAESGEAALAVLEKESVDVVLADENMPGMNGSRLLAEVSRRWPDAVRMMLTGTADMDVVCKAVNEGRISRIFTKPCNEAELIVAIRDALGAGTTPEEGGDALDGWAGATTLHTLDEGEQPTTAQAGSSSLRLVGEETTDEQGTTEGTGGDPASVIELDDADDVDDILADLDQLDRLGR